MSVLGDGHSDLVGGLAGIRYGLHSYGLHSDLVSGLARVRLNVPLTRSHQRVRPAYNTSFVSYGQHSTNGVAMLLCPATIGAIATRALKQC